MKFKVDKETCQSATTCIAFTFNDAVIYDLDDENKAEIVTSDDKKVQDKWVDVKEIKSVDDKNIENAEKVVLESAKGCPFNAIEVQDDEGKVIWPEIE